tara:strand:+ start:485 stop:3124 length:2640 start_codon:yes stop_codon:yes gene_type:complete
MLALATLRKESLLFFKDAWANYTHAGYVDGQRNQDRDVALALHCIVWPDRMRLVDVGEGSYKILAMLRSNDTSSKQLAVHQAGLLMTAKGWTEEQLLPVMLQRLDFANHTRTTKTMRWAAGSALYAQPDHAYNAFMNAHLLPTCPLPRFEAYLAAYREASAAVHLHPACTDEFPEIHTAEATSASLGGKGTGRAPLLLYAHLRRGDTWHSRRFSTRHSLNDRSRAAFHNRTRLAIDELAGLIDERELDAKWVIISDNYTAAEEGAAWVNKASSGQRQVATVLNSSCSICTMLSMRDADGILLSTMRGVSLYSFVPALMRGLPLYTVADRHSGDWSQSKAIPTFHRGQEAAFLNAVATLAGSRSSKTKAQPNATMWRVKRAAGALERLPTLDSHFCSESLVYSFPCEAAIVGASGSSERLHRRLRDRLSCKEGVGVNVIALGSSVQCGRRLNPCDGKKITGPGRPALKHDCHTDSFPARLERLLNTHWPCASGHHVHSECCSGCDTAYFTRLVRQGKQPYMDRLRAADWVLVETAVSDGFPEAARAKAERTPDGCPVDIRVQQNTEVLIRLLSSLPSQPALTWVAPTWRPKNVPPYYATAAEAQQPVLAYYSVLQVSLIHAWGSLQDKHLRKSVLREHHLDDYGHISSIGHNVTAFVLLHILRNGEARAKQPLPPYVDPQVQLPRQLLSQQALGTAVSQDMRAHCEVDFSVGAALDAVDLWNETATAPRVFFNSGFKFAEDILGKPGLIARVPGAELRLQLQTEKAPQPVRTCSIAIGFLSSYESAGVFVATPGSSCTDPVMQHGIMDLLRKNSTQHVMVDTLNHDSVSVYRSIQVRWVNNGAPPGCLQVVVGQRDGVTPVDEHDEHKVKLLDMTLGCAS